MDQLRPPHHVYPHRGMYTLRTLNTDPSSLEDPRVAAEVALIAESEGIPKVDPEQYRKACAYLCARILLENEFPDQYVAYADRWETVKHVEQLFRDVIAAAPTQKLLEDSLAKIPRQERSQGVQIEGVDGPPSLQQARVWLADEQNEHNG